MRDDFAQFYMNGPMPPYPPNMVRAIELFCTYFITLERAERRICKYRDKRNRAVYETPDERMACAAVQRTMKAELDPKLLECELSNEDYDKARRIALESVERNGYR